jgi:hypothetical protein
MTAVTPQAPVAPTVRDCPHCRARASYVIESRPTAIGRRRRYECQRCGSRDTTYEIDQATLDQFKQDSAHMQRIRAMLEAGTPPPTTPQIELHHCATCDMANGSRCSLTLPEAFTADAHDCSHYQPTK